MLMLTKPDKIPNQIRKESAKELAPAAMCLSQITWLRHTPTHINANISPILKKSDIHRAENHRPLSLTSVVSKLLEHIVN